jgi:hypothetical protein
MSSHFLPCLWGLGSPEILFTGELKPYLGVCQSRCVVVCGDEEAGQNEDGIKGAFAFFDHFPV